MNNNTKISAYINFVSASLYLKNSQTKQTIGNRWRSGGLAGTTTIVIMFGTTMAKTTTAATIHRRMLQLQRRHRPRGDGDGDGLLAPAAATGSIVVAAAVLYAHQKEEDILFCHSNWKKEDKIVPYYYYLNNHHHRASLKTCCESSSSSSSSSSKTTKPQSKYDDIDARQVSWMRRHILYPLGVMRLPTPRLITSSSDPSLQLPKSALRQRQKDEQQIRLLLEKAQQQQQQQQQNKNDTTVEQLSTQVFELLYGKGVTPQIREDFLIRYGCSGWTCEIVDTLLTVCKNRGIVEIGAGHGQWSRILNDAYNNNQNNKEKKGEQETANNASKSTTSNKSTTSTSKKQFDFVLAYDDQSNLPLNTHIYNQYTQPHHDYFGTVRKIGSDGQDKQLALEKIFRSWTCRGRALLLVYPPPGPMAANVLQTYIRAGPENDMLIYVGEGRDGANGDNEFFDVLTCGDWMLVKEMDVLRPPGNKGYEKLFIFRKWR